MYNRTIRVIDLDQLKPLKQIHTIDLPQNELIIDETGKFMPQQ